MGSISYPHLGHLDDPRHIVDAIHMLQVEQNECRMVADHCLFTGDSDGFDNATYSMQQAALEEKALIQVLGGGTVK